jgi:hypothetical protein
MSLLEWCQWLQDTEFGTGLRESLYLFSIIEGTHVLGLAMSVGAVMWFDLRLTGVKMRHQSVSEVFAHLKPLMVVGFTLMFVTGTLLFWANAARCYESTYFRIKVILLVLAGLNMLAFHLTIDRRRGEWDKAPTPPFPARLAGILSLVIWTGVIAAGRIMAYNL